MLIRNGCMGGNQGKKDQTGLMKRKKLVKKLCKVLEEPEHSGEKKNRISSVTSR